MTWPTELLGCVGNDGIAQSKVLRRWFTLAYARGTARLRECLFRLSASSFSRRSIRLGPGDERLAADWQCARVSLATVQRAMLLGCVGKSMSLLDRRGGEPALIYSKASQDD